MFELVYEDLEQTLFKVAGYEPSPEQRAIHEALLKPTQGASAPVPTMVVLAGGEQSGKSFLAGHHVFARHVFDDLIWLVGDRYEDAKREYEYARDAGVRADLVLPPSYAENGPWTLRYKTGQQVKVLSSEDVSKLAREAPNGIIMCEPGRQSYDAFRYLYRRCLPRTAWFLVAGTFEEDKGAIEPWYLELWEQCRGDNPYHARSMSLPSYANRMTYPLGEQDPQFRQDMQIVRNTAPTPEAADDEIGERFYGIPRKRRLTVFSEFSQMQHVKDYAQYLPGVEVHLAIDPGYANAFSVLFIQVISGQVRIFHEIYLRGVLGDDIMTMVEHHESFPDITSITMDIAATQHTNAERSAYENWVSHFGTMGDRHIAVGGQFVAIADGIAATRRQLQLNPVTHEPYLVVFPDCVNTIREFTTLYRYRMRHATGIIASELPIDEGNHSMKALAYYLVGRYGHTGKRSVLPAPVTRRPLYDVAFSAQRRQLAGRP